MSLLNFISLFLVLGIGADDVLVMSSTYELSKAKLNNADPRKRMRWAYYKAGEAMLVTTVTTCASFYSLCFSAVMVVARFGFFMGTVVFWNYVNVMVIFPTALLLSDLFYR